MFSDIKNTAAVKIHFIVSCIPLKINRALIVHAFDTPGEYR